MWDCVSVCVSSVCQAPGCGTSVCDNEDLPPEVAPSLSVGL